MSAPEKSSVATDTDIKKLGVLAGGGDVPFKLLKACDQSGIEVFVVGFEGHTSPELFADRQYMMTRLGAAGSVIDTLRTHKISDIVLIGSIRRPSLAELKPDMWAAQFFARVGLKSLGDDGLLSALKAELQSEGFQIHGVHQFVNNLLANEGFIGQQKPKSADQNSIKRGIEVSQLLGKADIGQSIVIQEDIVLGVEAIEGTDHLIERTGALKRSGRGPILIKTCKPNQDHDFDLPTIGPETVRKCIENGFAGIIIQAGYTIIIEPEEMAALADKDKLFIQAVSITGDDYAA